MVFYSFDVILFLLLLLNIWITYVGMWFFGHKLVLNKKAIQEEYWPICLHGWKDMKPKMMVVCVTEGVWLNIECLCNSMQ